MGVVPDEIDHNELRVILKSLKIKVRDLKNDVQPLLQKLKEGELKTSRGISFLEVKYQVLLQYISQLAIFAYAKLSGKQIEGHSLIESLVELRIVLERIKPIEAKLKYQIDKLVRQSVLESQAPGQAVDDPLSFKPNPMSLMDKEGQDENEDNDSDDGSEPTSGVYRPPKMAPVTYNELSSKTSKKDKDEQRMRERATRSSMMKDLMVDMNDAPEESGVYGGVHDDINFRSQMDRKLAEKKDYEENNYVRLQVTRKEKKHLRNKDRMLGREFENLSELGNLVGIREVNDIENERLKNVLHRSTRRSDGNAGTKRRSSGITGSGPLKNKFQRNMHFSSRQKPNK